MEHFSVRCSLGTTTDSRDLAEGRWNVETVALVRPAHFVIIKFAHTMQTS